MKARGIVRLVIRDELDTAVRRPKFDYGYSDKRLMRSHCDGMEVTLMPIDTEERAETRSRESSKAVITNVATYQHPMVASLNGRPVRIIATGDHAGSSPVCQYVDEDGRLNWEKASRFTIVDTQFLPPSAETLEHVFRDLTR